MASSIIDQDHFAAELCGLKADMLIMSYIAQTKTDKQVVDKHMEDLIACGMPVDFVSGEGDYPELGHVGSVLLAKSSFECFLILHDSSFLAKKRGDSL